jgi:putative phage-type endonuclease
LKIIDVEQGSPEWVALRKKKTTATDSAIIMNLNPWKSSLDLWREKKGLKEPDPINEKMIKGQRLEPIARQRICELSGIEYKPLVALHDQRTWQMASFDGVSESRKSLVEIKCGGVKLYEDCKKGMIPEYYECQVQHQLEIIGLDEAAFYVYFEDKGEFVGDVVLNVERNDSFIEEMNEREFEFWRTLGYD